MAYLLWHLLFTPKHDFMNKFFFSMCMVVIIPLQLYAQISTSIAQKFGLWTVVKTIDCNYMPPGTDGSFQTWDFSGLTALNPADTHRVQYIEATSSMLYPNASMVKKDGDKYTFYDYQANGVWGLGSVDNSVTPPDTIMFDDPMQAMKHPITYLHSFVDTFKANLGKPDSTKGYIMDTVESTGTLILPHDTFTNVIRMKFTIVSNLTMGGLPTTITRTSYQWYNKDISSWLLRIDSTLIANTAGNTTEKSTSYLLEEDPVSIKSMERERLNLIAAFNGNDIVIISGLQEDKVYNASLYDLSGRLITNVQLTGNTKTINTNKELTTGLYILSVTNMKNTSETAIIKLSKY